MISSKNRHFIFHVKKRMISLTVLSILLLSITTMTTVLGNNPNTALAQSVSSIPSSNDIGGSNNTLANQKSEQQE
jgi:hypothetical protein